MKIIYLRNCGYLLPNTAENRKLLVERAIAWDCGSTVNGPIAELRILDTSDLRGLAQDLVPRLEAIPTMHQKLTSLFADLIEYDEHR